MTTQKNGVTAQTKAAKPTTKKPPTRKKPAYQNPDAEIVTQKEASQLGRPSSYKPEYAKQAKKLCELGATDNDLADFFEVNECTINRWKIQFPDFCKSLKIGKDANDDRVEMSLYRKATGYSFESEEIKVIDDKVVRVPVIKHVPPDTTAMIFWLKNRKRFDWRDKVEVEHDVAADSPFATLITQLAGNVIKPESGDNSE